MKIYDPREEKLKVGTVLAIGSMAGIIGYASSLIKLARNIVIVPRLRIHRLDFNGLTIGAETNIENPTNGTVEVDHPFITIREAPEEDGNKGKGKVLATSKPSRLSYTIVKKATTELGDIKVHVPVESLIRLVSKVSQNKDIRLSVEIKAIIKLKYFISVALRERAEITIPGNILSNLFREKSAVSALGMIHLN